MKCYACGSVLPNPWWEDKIVLIRVGHQAKDIAKASKDGWGIIWLPGALTWDTHVRAVFRRDKKDNDST